MVGASGLISDPVRSPHPIRASGNTVQSEVHIQFGVTRSHSGEWWRAEGTKLSPGSGAYPPRSR